MSEFAKKALRGESTTDEEWRHHLIASHKDVPSMSPKAFAHCSTPTGESSYAFLARTVDTRAAKNITAIDLACGDGHLIPSLLPLIGKDGRVIGIDLCESDLVLAKQKIKDPRVSFYLNAADQIPLPDHSVDHVLCHMALMLMVPIEPVVRELGRVLKPGGKFSAVTGSSLATGLFAEIRQTHLGFIDSKHPKLRKARLGDPRTGSLAGLNELFTAGLGFQPLEEWTEFGINVKTGPSGIWDFMEDMYLIAMLPHQEKMELKEMFTHLGERHQDAEGKVQFIFPMRLFTILKK